MGPTIAGPDCASTIAAQRRERNEGLARFICRFVLAHERRGAVVAAALGGDVGEV